MFVIIRELSRNIWGMCNHQLHYIDINYEAKKWEWGYQMI